MSLIRITGAVVGNTYRNLGRVIYRTTEFINKKEKPKLRLRVANSWTRALVGPTEFKPESLARQWWCRPLVPALGGQRQADL